MPDSPIEVFFSYCHEDEKHRRKLDNHLTSMKHEGLVSTWYDGVIHAGAELDIEINQHLETAPVILLLISDLFMASRYCYCKEMIKAVARHDMGDAIVIPIILSPVDWVITPFARLKPLPKHGKAITLWPNRNSAYKDAALGIRHSIGGKRGEPRIEPVSSSSSIKTLDAEPQESAHILKLKTLIDEGRIGDDFLQGHQRKILDQLM